MPKAVRKLTPEQSRFEDAVEFLPHVRSHSAGRDFWNIGETIVGQDGKPHVTANYTMDYVLGKALGRNFAEVISRYPDQAGWLTEHVLKDMVKVNRASGVEYGFIDFIAALVERGARAGAPKLTVIKADGAEQPNCSAGITE